jgi:hypothetical protein
MMRLRSLIVAAAVPLALACGDDGPTAPNVDFPDLFPSVALDSVCYKGNRTVFQGISSRIGPEDCDATPLNTVIGITGYYEGWRIRVDMTRTIIFDVNAVFDGYMVLARIDSVVGGDSLAYTILAQDDDGGLDFNPRISRSLDPGIDYLLILSGYDKPTGQGDYSISIHE